MASPSPHSSGGSSADASTTLPSEPAPAKGLWLEDWLTVLIMALLALITFGNVIVRYFTDGSFAWTEEISVFLMILLAMVAGSAAVARNLHIRIEYFAERGDARRRKAFARFGALTVALLFALICVLSIRVVVDDYRYEETSPGIGVPQWWYSIWLPVFSALITLRALGLFLRQGRASFAHVYSEGSDAAAKERA
ncbi:MULTISPECIES: TRAP transporter small permease [unclassified Comamonas]|uniref:TRAP transporter small permease n=1 Tax=unclassified Comamonas TaxID=2638500 RepID=UPI000395DDD3|nr:TRAP transporter small permease [Comamonas sp. B-9]